MVPVTRIWYVLCVSLLVTVRCQQQVVVNSTVIGSGRRFACPNALTVVTCEVTNITDSQNAIVSIIIQQPGEELLEYLFNGPPQVITTGTFNVVQTVVQETVREFSTTFSLPPGGIDISCTLGNDSDFTLIREAGTPNQPRITQLEVYQENASRYVVALRWEGGQENSDIDFYEVQVVGVSAMTRVRDTEDVVVVDSPPPETVTVNVTAVSKCGARSQPGSSVTTVSAVTTEADVGVTTNCTESAAASVEAGVAVLMSTLLTLLTV